MAKEKEIYKNEIIEGEFLEIKVPETNWVKIELKSTRNTVENKSGDVLRVLNDYTINISMAEKLTTEDSYFSNEFKTIIGLNFAPYKYKEKSYNFYTSKYTGDDNRKKEILQEIFDLIKDFEIKKNKDLESNSKLYSEDVKNNLSINIDNLGMKYSEDLKCFVVIVKDFLGNDNGIDVYRLLANGSLDNFKLTDKNKTIDGQLNIKKNELYIKNKDILNEKFFEEFKLKKIDGKSVFFIGESNYDKIKEYFLTKLEDKENFLLTQKNLFSKTKNVEDVEILDENVFGLHISINKERNCFNFKCKGYKSTYNTFFPQFQMGGFKPRMGERSVATMIAANFIYSNENEKLENENNYIDRSNNLLENKEFISLDLIKDKNEDVLLVKVSDIDKLKKIKENYEKIKELWNRSDKKIKIKNVYLDRLDTYPAIYFHKNKPILIYSIRETGELNKYRADNNDLSSNPTVNDDFPQIYIGETSKLKPYSATLTGKEITYDEAMYFLNEHEFNEQIKIRSVSLNAKAHGGAIGKSLSKEEQEKIYETVLLMAKIEKESKVKNTSKKTLKI